VERSVTPRAVLIGLVFEGPERMAQTFMGLFEEGERLGMQVRERVEAHARGLAEVGRIEEVHSRTLARQRLRKVADGLSDRLAGAAQIRELIAMAGTTLAKELMAAMQERTALANDRMEHLVRSLFHGRVPAREAEPSQEEPAPSPLVFPTRPVPAHL
jgi:hypothetical protein